MTFVQRLAAANVGHDSGDWVQKATSFSTSYSRQTSLSSPAPAADGSFFDAGIGKRNHNVCLLRVLIPQDGDSSRISDTNSLPIHSHHEASGSASEACKSIPLSH